MASGNMKLIRRRIKSVESTMQITKAMELVASSKLRRAKERADACRPYFTALYETMCEIQSENPAFFSPFTRKKEEGEILLIVVAGDRGLAGGFNNNIFKLVDKRLEELGNGVQILAIGKKACEYYTKRGRKMYKTLPGIAETLHMSEATAIANDITAEYEQGKFKRAELFYTNYVSPLTQTAASLPILPVDIPKEPPSYRAVPEYEPSAAEVFDHIVPRYIAGMIFGTIADSYASEQAARRNAMENASDNADEMIGRLSLEYNRARQAAITQEITEIVRGANAGQ
ncbi:MAG: ATP synthase F1 subunit gamma [Oscillospiraceae bacterium]|nr:ATP synthase F1 subunit gamma [Oscillospiraceae bacterium]